MYDSKDLKAIVIFEVDPVLFETDNEDEELVKEGDNHAISYKSI